MNEKNKNFKTRGSSLGFMDFKKSLNSLKLLVKSTMGIFQVRGPTLSSHSQRVYDS